MEYTITSTTHGRPKTLLPGERVRLLSGALSGLYGVVIAAKRKQRFMIKIDCLPKGVFAIVPVDRLKRCSSGPPSPASLLLFVPVSASGVTGLI